MQKENQYYKKGKENNNKTRWCAVRVWDERDKKVTKREKKLTVVHDSQVQLTIHPTLVSRHVEIAQRLLVILSDAAAMQVHNAQTTQTDGISLQSEKWRWYLGERKHTGHISDILPQNPFEKGWKK